jgi:hypothetical protein
MLLETSEDVPDLFRPAQVSYRGGYSVIVFELQQERQLFPVQFLLRQL